MMKKKKTRTTRRRLATENPLCIIIAEGPKMMPILLECNYDTTEPSRLHLLLLDSVFVHLKTSGRAWRAHAKITCVFCSPPTVKPTVKLVFAGGSWSLLLAVITSLDSGVTVWDLGAGGWSLLSSGTKL